MSAGYEASRLDVIIDLAMIGCGRIVMFVLALCRCVSRARVLAKGNFICNLGRASLWNCTYAIENPLVEIVRNMVIAVSKHQG